ncbi:asialoglycoprotein receptor 1 isoform X1 [Chanodichthys erythropterus]|uniref:asialoglycoprotein receptor 1 isoform X1 n=2 Tax=Chanodichthys erythropterus TaxID=933992 RepID=UPI00351F1FFE
MKIEMDRSEEYIKMEMECESKKSLRRGRPCSRQTGILVLLGTVCMITFMILNSVIFSNQSRKFSVLESWMNSHTSDLTSVKSEFQTTGTDLEKKVSELQDLVSSLSSYLNTSEPSNPMINEMHEKKLSNIETLITELHSSLNSHTSKQEENLQNLADSLMSSLLSLRSYSRTHRISIDMSGSLTDVKRSLEEIRSSVRKVSYKLSFTNSLPSGCSELDWIPFSNSCYLFSDDSMNWTQAKDYCEKQGALLLKIEEGSEKEWEFATNFVKPQEYWVGLTDQNTGKWRWADDTPYTSKAHWRPGQPDEWTDHGLGGKGEEGEDCGQISYDGMLNDIHCSSKLKYICEKGNQD